jgi:peptide/nickel transport system permease protein
MRSVIMDGTRVGTADLSRWSLFVARVTDSDLWHRFRRSPAAMAGAAAIAAFVFLALFAPWIAPQNPFDPAKLDILDANLPPAWLHDGNWQYILGTDRQGRDVLSAILFGLRVSLLVSLAATLFALLVGVTAGLLAGYSRGLVDNVLMRMADIQLSFPAILIALLIDGISRNVLSHAVHRDLTVPIVIAAIGMSNWVQFARTVRGSVMVEREKEYVQAATISGVSMPRILATHILPNVLGPVLVLGTLGLGLAVLTEAALSYLGVGVPATQPSLGTLVRIGNEVLFSGEWWISIFPGLALVLLVLAVNLFGDWLRDALNPKLR